MKKELLDTSGWKEFKFTDLFTICKSNNSVKREMDENGKYPYLSASSRNKGITGKSNTYNLPYAWVVAIGGSNGYSYSHSYPVYVQYDNLTNIKPKFETSKNITQFMCSIITDTYSPKYNFGNQLTKSKLELETLWLPEKDGEPDWEFMESYIDKLNSEVEKDINI